MTALVAEYTAGASAADLARAYGVSGSTVGKWLKDAGVDVRSTTRIDLDITALAAGYESGESVVALSRKHGVHVMTIYHRLTEAGVQMRSRSEAARIDIDTATLVREYESGASTYELAAKHGVTPPTISVRLDEAGVQRHGPGAKYRISIDMATLAAEYAAGANTYELAAKHGVSPALVNNRLKEAGVVLRTTARSDIESAELVREYEAGSSAVVLARKYGVHTATVYLHLKNAGVERRDARRPGLKSTALAAEYEAGATITDLAEKYDLHPATVRKRLRDVGAMRPRPPATPMSRRVRALFLWACAVKELAGGVCAECGDHKDLHAHHVLPKRDYPEMAFAIDNGIALCRNCHYAVHHPTRAS
jgi:transposase-like protein